MSNRAALTILMTVLGLTACGGAGGGSSATDTGAASSTGSSAGDPGLDASGLPISTPVVTTGAALNLDGTYKLQFTKCNTSVTSPTAEQYMDVIHNELQVRTYLTGCTAVKPTIRYDLTYDATTFAMNPIYTDVYSAPGNCGSPTRNYAMAPDWTTLDWVQAGIYFVLLTRNNCDGLGHRTLTYYKKQ